MKRGAPRVTILAAFLIIALLGQAAVSTAAPAGTELAEEISAETSGAEAWASLLDVSGFPPAGQAIFEPGTPYEEVFSYDAVDEASNRLVGLTRPTPISHSAGTFVQAAETTPSPTPTPPSSPAPSDPPAEQDSPPSASPSAAQPPQEDSSELTTGGTGSQEPASTEVASSAAADEGPDPCDVVTGRTCSTIISDLVGTIGCSDDSVCQLVNQVLTDPFGWLGCTDDPVCDLVGRVLSTIDTCTSNPAACEPPDPLNMLGCTDDPVCNLIGDALVTVNRCQEQVQACEPVNPSGTYSQPVETIIPLPDLGETSDDLHTPCFAFVRTTKIGIEKQAWDPDAKEYAEGYVRSNCGERRIPTLKVQAAIYHHSALPLFGSTVSTQDPSEGPGPGPVYGHAFQEVRVVPDHAYGSKINFYMIYRAIPRNGIPWSHMECYSMMYGLTAVTPVSCGEDTPPLLDFVLG